MDEVKGIVFDLDGTLISSKIDFYKMKRRMIDILESEGVETGLLSPKESTVTILQKSEKVWNKIEKLDKEKRKVMTIINEVINQTELEAIETITEVEGARRAVQILRDRGYRLAILTRSHHQYAIEALGKTGMLKYFDVIFGRDDTPRPKPHPAALIDVAKHMKLKTVEIIFVSDHPMDSICANEADVPFIGVLTGWAGDDAWSEYKLVTVLSSVGELPDYLNKI